MAQLGFGSRFTAGLLVCVIGALKIRADLHAHLAERTRFRPAAERPAHPVPEQVKGAN